MNTDWIIEIALPIATFVCSVFGVFGFFRSIRKPRARLRFANGKRKITFTPLYYRKKSDKYYMDPPTDCYDSHAYIEMHKHYNKLHEDDCKFLIPFQVINTGKLQLEDYRVEINVVGGKCQLLHSKDNFKEGNNIQNSLLDGVSINRLRIEYEPVAPLKKLNQKDHDDFAIRFTPDPDVMQYELHWRIIAKDFYRTGKLFIKFIPTIEEYDELHFVNCQHDIPEGAEVIKDLKPYIRSLADKLNFWK